MRKNRLPWNRTAGKEVGCHGHTVLFIAWHRAVLSLLRCCTAFIVLIASEASGQCTARDVLRNTDVQEKFLQQIGRQFQSDPPTLLRCGDNCGRDVCKFVCLRKRVGCGRCGIGDQAEEILARPAFAV